MTDRKIRTLAYTKSPKASRRTTFQDELEAAVSSRSSKKTTAQYSYSDEFDEDDNDFLKDLLKSRKKRNALAAMKKMAKMNDFELSDDEGEKSRPKRVSFLKTQRVVTSSQDIMAPDSQQDEHLPEPSNSNQNDSSDSQLSQSFNKEHSKSAASDMSDMDRTHSQSTSLPLQSESGIMESPLLPESSELRRDSVHEEGSEANSPQPLETSSAHISTDGTVERELPTPKPRARTRALRSQGIVDLTEDAGTPQSRAMTSSVSIPLSSDTASNSTTSPRRATSRSCSLPVPERDQSDSINSSQARTERSRSLTISTVDSGTKDYHTSDDSKAHEGKYSMSFEEFHEHSEEHLDHSISRLSHGPENSPDTRTPSLLIKCPRRSQSACSSKVKSKYMGTLKVLDRKVPGEVSQPEAADSLRAAIYQEWLQKKKEKLRENMQLKTQEDNLKEEKKKKQEQDKREHAIASYNAWKEKKSETLKEKAKQKHATIRKEQRAIEEKEEKKEAAKKMFEKWKQEHDELLKEKYRQQKGAESKHKQKKQHTEEERKKDSNSAFSDWKEKKKTFVMEKITEERKENKNKAEEETYLKEEKDKMALEMYEKWLIKKEREQRRQREERKIQAILEDEPPPPWSPPNKTIPFRK